MSDATAELDFDSIIITWPAAPAPSGSLNHQIFTLLREKLPGDHPKGFEVGGYASDPARGLESVMLNADAGHGPELLAWARQQLRGQPLPHGATITLQSAFDTRPVQTPIRQAALN